MLDELIELERIIEEGSPHLRVRSLCRVETGAHTFPVYALSLGSGNPGAPAVGFFGGIHGLERIGTHVLLAYLGSLVARLRWDDVLHRQLEQVRLVFMPLINPGGMSRRMRCNPNGVDLMRNAPVDAVGRVPFLLGGQRISARLPWYRGAADAPMQIESQAVCRTVEQELLGAEFSIALDCHSGFGLLDRIWFPHAHTATPIRHLAEIHALKDLFDRTCPHHDYLFEPQSRQYLAHGDLWDYLYLKALGERRRVFLPLTLEMGSWRWVKKSPRQMFSRLGIFNPLPRHRLHRVLRRHLVWLDFLTRAASAWRNWIPTAETRMQHRQAAVQRWYRDTAP